MSSFPCMLPPCTPFLACILPSIYSLCIPTAIFWQAYVVAHCIMASWNGKDPPTHIRCDNGRAFVAELIQVFSCLSSRHIPKTSIPTSHRLRIPPKHPFPPPRPSPHLPLHLASPTTINPHPHPVHPLLPPHQAPVGAEAVPLLPFVILRPSVATTGSSSFNFAIRSKHVPLMAGI